MSDAPHEPDRPAERHAGAAAGENTSHVEPAAVSHGPRRRTTIAALLALAMLLTAIVAVILIYRVPEVTVSEVDMVDLAHTTLQQEISAAFLVTGELIVTAETRVQNTKTLLPGLLDVDLGTTSAQVRVPGRVIYGIYADSLSRDRIHMADDSVIEIMLPTPRVYAVEPRLSEMEVETRRGWARLSRETEEQVRQRAIGLVERSLRAQGHRHLMQSVQPRVNTARALESLLRPAFEAAGIRPEFRFRIGEEVTWESMPDR
jgi:hypothetical protein